MRYKDTKEGYLRDSNDPNDVILGISTGGSIHKKVAYFVRLGTELELVVRGLNAL